jgi:hypothetical protein
MEEKEAALYIQDMEHNSGVALMSFKAIALKKLEYDPETFPIPIVSRPGWTYDLPEIKKRKEYVDDVAALNRPLDINVLRDNLETLRTNLQIIDIIKLVEKRIRTWESPLVSFALFLVISKYPIFGVQSTENLSR